MTVPLYLCICVGLPPYLVSRFSLTPTTGFYISLYPPPASRMMKGPPTLNYGDPF